MHLAHPGSLPAATCQKQAQFILELLVDLGGRALFRTIRDHARLPDERLANALALLSSQGYVSCRIRIDQLVLYSVTELGMGTVDLLQDLGQGAATS
jgi:hypothetical protein